MEAIGGRTRGEVRRNKEVFRGEVGPLIADYVEREQQWLVSVEARVWFPGWAVLRAGVSRWTVKTVYVWVRTGFHPEFSRVQLQMMDYVYQCWPTLSAGAESVDVELNQLDGGRALAGVVCADVHFTRECIDPYTGTCGKYG